MTCYRCGPATTYRWLCPSCRQAYTFTREGRVVLRKPGQMGIFELKTPMTFAQFAMGGQRERKQDS